MLLECFTDALWIYYDSRNGKSKFYELSTDNSVIYEYSYLTVIPMHEEMLVSHESCDVVKPIIKYLIRIFNTFLNNYCETLNS